MESERHRHRRYANDILTLLEEKYNVTMWTDKDITTFVRNQMEEIDATYKGLKVCIIHPATMGLLAGTWWFFCNNTKLDANYRYIIIQDDSRHGRIGEVANAALWEIICRKCELINQENVNFWYNYILRHISSIKGIFSRYNEYCSGRAKDYFSLGHLESFAVSSQDFFKKEEINFGNEGIRKLGIKGDYICVYARDSAYYETKCEKTDVMEFLIDICKSYRDSDISLFLEAASKMKEKGVQCVRVGNLVSGHIEGDIIDYPNINTSPLMDLIIFSRCKFFIGDGSGIQNIAMVFGKPIVNVNFPFVFNYGDGMMEGELVIYRKLYDTNKRKYLTLREIFNLEYSLYKELLKRTGFYNFGNEFIKYMRENKIIAECNTSVEISEVAEEMLQRLNGTVNYSPRVKVLRNKYRNMMKEFCQYAPFTTCVAEVGAQWLLDNEWFLD